MWRVIILDGLLALFVLAGFFLLFKALYKSRPVRALASDGDDVMEKAEEVKEEISERRAVLDAAERAVQAEKDRLEALFPEHRK